MLLNEKYVSKSALAPLLAIERVPPRPSLFVASGGNSRLATTLDVVENTKRAAS